MYMYVYIYIYMYIHTYVHENRSIPVLSIPFQRVLVITCVRTLVHIFNRRHDLKFHESTLSIIISSLTQNGLDLILHVWIF